MGEVIRRNASIEDIHADARTTMTNATARGGDWAEVAEEQLTPVLGVIDLVQTRLGQTEQELIPLEAALAAADETADRLVGKVSDDTWNAVGRPGSDPVLSLLYPGGIRYYTGGSVDEQPERMDLLADLLKIGLHKKLDPETAKVSSREVREGAASLRSAVDAARVPRVRAEMLRRMRTAVGRHAQMELVHLKRRYKINGFSEAEIHAVIPDRSRPAPSKPGGSPAS